MRNKHCFEANASNTGTTEIRFADIFSTASNGIVGVLSFRPLSHILVTSGVIRMACESYLYDKIDTELYKTDGYSGSDTDVDATERFTSDIDLTVNIGANVDFKFTGSGSADDLVLSLYERRDVNWGDGEIAIWSATVNNSGSESLYSFTIDSSYGAGHYRFGMKSSGATDTFEIDTEMRQWRRTTSIA